MAGAFCTAAIAPVFPASWGRLQGIIRAHLRARRDCFRGGRKLNKMLRKNFNSSGIAQ